MRVWIASFELALEPILGSRLTRIAFFIAFFVMARVRIDHALKIPGVTSGAILNEISIAFLWTMAGAAMLCLVWAVPVTIWTRLSIARSNRVKQR